MKNFYIAGMSPGNSYFKDDEVRHLLDRAVKQYGQIAILVADIPAISTYIALGYPENRARRDKAIPKGNALKNRVKKVAAKLGYGNNKIRIFNWKEEVAENQYYLKRYDQLKKFYQSNQPFRDAAREATRDVLFYSKRNIDNLEKATSLAIHYLLSEFAFLEFAPKYIEVDKVTYVYHKNWPVYEDYIDGKFDQVIRSHLGFQIILPSASSPSNA